MLLPLRFLFLPLHEFLTNHLLCYFLEEHAFLRLRRMCVSACTHQSSLTYTHSRLHSHTICYLPICLTHGGPDPLTQQHHCLIIQHLIGPFYWHYWSLTEQTLSHPHLSLSWVPSFISSPSKLSSYVHTFLSTFSMEHALFLGISLDVSFCSIWEEGGVLPPFWDQVFHDLYLNPTLSHFLHLSSLSHLLTSSSSPFQGIFPIPRMVFLLRFPFNPPTLCATAFSPSKNSAGWPNCSSPGGFLCPPRAPLSHLPTEACWVLTHLGGGVGGVFTSLHSFPASHPLPNNNEHTHFYQKK